MDATELRRRTVLGALGTTSVCSLHTVAATDSDHPTDSETEHGHSTTYVSIESTRLGRVDPEEIVPRDVESFGENERRAITAATSSRSGTLVGEPTFPLGSVVTVDGRYYELSFARVDDVHAIVPTLNAEQLDAHTLDTRNVTSVDTFGELASKPVRRAIARARHLAARTHRGDGASDANSPSNRPAYVFNPNETVPMVLSSQPGEFIVEQQDAYYRLGYEVQSAPVPKFDVAAIEVAGSPESFDDWFVDEYVTVDDEISALSVEEQHLISTATADGHSEQAPYSNELNSILDRMGVSRQSSAKSKRYLRLDDELHYVAVSQAVGC